MSKSGKIYAVYVAAVLVAGSLYAAFTSSSHNKNNDNVNVIIHSSQTTVPATAASTAKKTTTSKITSVKTTTSRTTTVKTTTAAETTEAVVLWFDLNEATAQQLALLPGIGEKLAEEIVSYRSAYGSFRNIEEIMKVSGIGESKFEAIRDYIYVTDPIYDEAPAEDTQNENEPVQEVTEYVPTLEDLAPIDLNTATKEELMLLPHVDETIAERIIAFREQAGGFSHPYELLYIEGLTRDKAAEIIDHVRVGDEQS